MSQLSVRLEHLQATPLAVIRRQVRTSELAAVVPEGCGIVWNFIRQHNLQGDRHVAVYWDGSIRLEVGVELAEPFEERDGIVRSATPAGLTATSTHWGPYAQMHRAHEAIREWCAAHRYTLTGPSWEVYGHWQNEWNTDPSRIRTDVFYQVAPLDALKRVL